MYDKPTSISKFELMKIAKLNAEQLYSAMLAGCHAVIREREYLNTINVFPVQDGDTGDNMAATAHSVIHNATLKNSIKDTLQSVAYASMTGARGNSGMIFSQFFNALADFAKHEEETLSMQSFGELLNKAAKRVRTAILNPIDGTMLTIMEYWSTYTDEAAEQIPCFKSALQNITDKLHDAVAQTTQAIAALKAANVVDAGALGFFHFVSGFSRYIADPQSLPKQDIEKLKPISHTDLDFCANEPPKDGRYCTEAMLTHDSLNQPLLMEILQQYGSSIVVSANAAQCRFHLHTDKPWEVFNAIMPLGKISAPKVDDMLRQYETLSLKKHDIALVTDSNADLPNAYFDENQIHILPLNVHIEGNDLLDKYSIHPGQFYKQLNSYTSNPKTSAPSTLAMEQKLRPLAEKYAEVIVLTIAKPLISTHDSLKHVAAKFPNVHVLDSKLCSGAQGLLIMEAVEAIKLNKPVEFVLTQIKNFIPKIQLYFIINDMSALIRSGRMNKIIGKMAQLSGLKPIFSLNTEGKTHLVGQAFNETAALNKMLQLAKEPIKNGAKLKSYCLMHADYPQAAKTLAEQTTALFNIPPLYIESAAVTIGSHAGAGCIGIATCIA